jgi:16S rRNA (uracil1498-N3)-methyltransferase
VTDPLFLRDDLPDPLPAIGSRVSLEGEEGRHAVVVRRIQVGETILVADGRGRGVSGPVVEVARSGLVVEVAAQLAAPARPLRFVAAQALAKGDRSELAIEMLTELGIDEILPWQASRSVVRWSGERGERSRARWASTVREAAKQARRLRVPVIGAVVNTRKLAEAVASAELALILHEEATEALARVHLPAAGTVLLVIGPEGGIASDELGAFVAAGGRPVSVSDGVLRTSTAGAVALAGLLLR